MAVNEPLHFIVGNPGTDVATSGGRADGPLAWANIGGGLRNPLTGAHFADHFMPYSTSNWTETTVGSGASITAIPAGPNGLVSFTAGSSASSNDGGQIQSVGSGFVMMPGTPNRKTRLCWEAGLIVAVPDKVLLAAGLAAVDTTIHSGGNLDSNLEGILLFTDATSIADDLANNVPVGVWLWYKPDVATAGVRVRTLLVLDAGVKHRLGVAIDSDGNLAAYADNVPIASFKAEPKPTVPLVPSIGSHALDTTMQSADMLADWFIAATG